MGRIYPPCHGSHGSIISIHLILLIFTCKIPSFIHPPHRINHYLDWMSCLVLGELLFKKKTSSRLFSKFAGPSLNVSFRTVQSEGRISRLFEGILHYLRTAFIWSWYGFFDFQKKLLPSACFFVENPLRNAILGHLHYVGFHKANQCLTMELVLNK